MRQGLRAVSSLVVGCVLVAMLPATARAQIDEPDVWNPPEHWYYTLQCSTSSLASGTSRLHPHPSRSDKVVCVKTAYENFAPKRDCEQTGLEPAIKELPGYDRCVEASASVYSPECAMAGSGKIIQAGRDICPPKGSSLPLECRPWYSYVTDASGDEDLCKPALWDRPECPAGWARELDVEGIRDMCRRRTPGPPKVERSAEAEQGALESEPSWTPPGSGGREPETLGVAVSSVTPGPAGSHYDLADGVTFEVTALRRVGDGIVHLDFAIHNHTQEAIDPMRWGILRWVGAGPTTQATGIELQDLAGARTYRAGNASQGSLGVDAGSRREYWAQYVGVPADVTRVTLLFPDAPPLYDVPIR